MIHATSKLNSSQINKAYYSPWDDSIHSDSSQDTFIMRYRRHFCTCVLMMGYIFPRSSQGITLVVNKTTWSLSPKDTLSQNLSISREWKLKLLSQGWEALSPYSPNSYTWHVLNCRISGKGFSGQGLEAKFSFDSVIPHSPQRQAAEIPTFLFQSRSQKTDNLFPKTRLPKSSAVKLPWLSM